MRKNILTRFTALALAAVLAVGLSACGGAASKSHTAPPRQESPSVQEPAPEQSAASEPESAGEVQAQDPAGEAQTQDPAGGTDPDANSKTESERIQERLERIKKAQEQANNAAKDEPAAEPAVDMASVEGITRLAELIGTGELSRYKDHDTVDVNDEHNPYDLVWQYGRKEDGKSDDFGAFYASYVNAADWSLVFDAEYYKKAFPMLAKLYHQDDALLLEHFQTVGVHEGRQGSKGFNVSVYMSNCSKDLLDAFGDAYECYYFYYMLNHGTESKADTAGTYGKDPLWLDLELTLAQKHELSRINWYRDELGAEPLELDPENIAFANYRAWYNAVNTLRGHGWLEDMDNPDVDAVFDLLGVNHLGENTTTITGSAHADSTLMPYSVHYRASKDHYEAMVRTNYLYLGVSHMYYNGGTSWMCQFDTFLREQPKPDHTMR